MKLDLPPTAYTSIAVAVAIPIVFGFFKATGFFSRTQRIHKTLSLKQLAAKYQAWEAFSIIPFFAFTAGGAYLCFRGLKALSTIPQPPQSPETLFLSAPDAAWWIPSLFIGIIFSAIPVVLLMKLILGARYAEFECYSDMKVGFNTNRAFGFIGVVILGLSIMLSVALFSFYWKFDKDGFAMNPFWDLKETRYAYSDIKELRLIAKFRAPNGNLKNSPYYEIVTKDGRHWSSKTGPSDDMVVLKPLFETLTRRSGVRVVRYDLSPDDSAR